MSAPIRAAKIMSHGQTSAATAKEIVELVNKGREWYRNKTQWTVTIASTDTLFDVAHGWFTEIAQSQDNPPKSLEARYERRSAKFDSMSAIASPDRDASEHQVSFYFDDSAERVVNLYGHDVRVALHKPGQAPKTGKSGDVMSEIVSSWQPEVLTFYATSRDGQQAVIRKLQELASFKEDMKPCLRMMNNWGGWSKRDDIPPRPLSSVVLRTGQIERIRNDLKDFLDSEAEYNARGIPWHRGVLLYGPPGTGKTSVVKAVAHDLGLDLWYAPLGDINKDTSLLNAVSEVRPRSILLLEDIDVFQAAREREDNSGKASMAALLNALDGVATPHGMIAVLTTNNIGVIDDALLRPGRIDLVEEIGLPDREQVRRLYETFYGVPFVGKLHKELASTAHYMEIFKRHMHDPQGALTAITY